MKLLHYCLEDVVNKFSPVQISNGKHDVIWFCCVFCCQTSQFKLATALLHQHAKVEKLLSKPQYSNVPTMHPQVILIEGLFLETHLRRSWLAHNVVKLPTGLYVATEREKGQYIKCIQYQQMVVTSLYLISSKICDAVLLWLPYKKCISCLNDSSS